MGKEDGAPAATAATAAEVERAYELSLENFEALGVLQHDGHLFLPTKLRSRNARGGLDEVPALLRMPDHEQQRRARLESRAACKALGYDLDLDRDRFKEAENHWLLCFALRDPATRGQLEPRPEDLVARFTEPTLAECWTQLQLWTDLHDPRYGKLSGEQLWQVTAAIAQGGNMLPLAALPGYEQATCIVVMAQEACNSPNAPSPLNSRSKSALDG